jgi:hypothetical protein
MNCDESIERLPWMLNGTLEEGEHDEVRRHLATCERCRAALNDTREAWTIFDQHLPSDTLVALAYGEAPQGLDSALAERHLASCPQCAAELELARMSRRLEEDDKVAVFPGPRAPKAEVAREGSRTWRAATLAAGLAGLVAASGWIYEFQQAGDLAERLAQQPAAVQESRPAAPVPAPPVQPDSDASAAQLANLQKQLDAARQQVQQNQATLEKATQRVAEFSRSAMEPQLNAQVVTGPEVVRDGSGTEAREAVLPGDQPAMLTLPAESKGAVRTVEIVDGGGKVVWSGAGLRSDKDLEYKIQFHSGFLKPGRYTIQLYETVSGKQAPRERYAIRVQ